VKFKQQYSTFQTMSFQEFATPAPQVELAEAAPPTISDEVQAEPAKFSEEARVEPAPHSGPAVPFDKKFAPKITQEEASGLSVAVLRGGGTDFESEAAIIKGGVEKNFLRRNPIVGKFFDFRDYVTFGEVRRYIFIKGNCVFVYGQVTDPYPLYAIELETVTAELEDPLKPDPYSFTVCPQVQTNRTGSHLATVLLKDKSTRKQAFQITFDTSQDKSVAKRFMDVFHTNAKHYGVTEVVTASVVTAKALAKEFSK
jgi:hypothetical protein